MSIISPERSPTGSPEDAPAEDAGGAPHISATALGPADVRDTPQVKSSFETPTEEQPEDDPWIGRTLSKVYEIESKIGEGGMGSVYLARHIHLQKAFAIKVLIDSIAGKGNAVERLQQEAMAAANIDHENIVDVVNFDRTDEGAVFIVMELLKGESLADAIGRGPISLHRALPIGFQICRALHAAHEHGIVHRDLKPENVFLTEKGGRTLVKVLDFGISKIKRAESEQVRMTKTGQLVGTPLYMSPEQARGESEIDRRVDVYAMGVILFEMITGAPPFDGRNYFELLWKHGNEPPPSMKEINPNVHIPDAVDAVVLKTLAKDRDARYQTLLEVEHALMKAAPDVPSLPAMPSLPPERPRVGGPVGPTRKMLAHAATEAMETGDELAATPNGTAEVALPQRKIGPLLAVAAAAVLLVGAVGYALTREDPTLETTVGEPPAEEEGRPEEPISEVESESGATDDPAAETRPPPGVDPPPTPQRVSVTLSSSPDGAEVSVGDRVLGTTPLTVPIEVSDEAITLRFRKAGYLDQTLSVVPAAGLEVPEVRLRRRRQAQPQPSGSGSLPIKTGL
ncbi:MAG: hypothetical protein SangKO_091060 [Sandaracinaceae bacterium]